MGKCKHCKHQDHKHDHQTKCQSKQHECANVCEVLVERNYEGNCDLAQYQADFGHPFGGFDGTPFCTGEALVIDSRRYTTTGLGIQDHVKFLAFFQPDQPIELLDGYETVYEIEVASKQVLRFDQIPPEFLPRIRNMSEDIRLAAGAINIVDPETFMIFDFLLADDAIYAFYERLPLRPADEAAFSYAKLVSRRTGDPLNDFVKLGIGIDKKHNVVNWYLNGQKVWTVERIGVRIEEEYKMMEHGGRSVLVDINQVLVGFGNFTLLDMGLPNNYDRTLTTKNETYPNGDVAKSQLVQLSPDEEYRQLYQYEDGELKPPIPPITWSIAAPNDDPTLIPPNKKIFGQGNILKVKNFRVIRRPVFDMCGLEV